MTLRARDRGLEPGARSPGSRHVLAAAASGGHFKQLTRLVDRIPDLGAVTWLTYDRGPTEELLRGSPRANDRLVFAPYAAPRDIPNLLRNARVARHLLREEPFDLAVSTGPGIAVATLPTARTMGVRSVFIETATRSSGPSVSGRILEHVPGIELCTQQTDGYGPAWRRVGSVLDEFERGPDRTHAALRRIVVTVGTIRPYGFRRLVDHLLRLLPAGTEVLWQTGATPVADLPIRARDIVPAVELEAAMSVADVVIGHAGTGTALTAFELGLCPVLVPRRRYAHEHVDDHQVLTARELDQRGLAIHAEVERLDLSVLETAAGRSVTRRSDVPLLVL